MNQEEIWDIIAPRWFEFKNKPLDFASEFVKKQKGRMLDLGCGSGRFFINKKGLKIYGVDFSRKMLYYAEKKAIKDNLPVVLFKSEISNLPFKDCFFDSSIFIASLHCLESVKKRKQALKELYRVLKPGAESMISVWSKNHQRLKNKEKKDYVPWTINKKQVFRFNYIYEKDELEKLLKAIGFKIIYIKEDLNIIALVKK